MRVVHVGNLLVALACLSGARPAHPGPEREPDPFPATAARYQQYLRRPSFFMRTRGRILLCETQDARAVPLLARDYATPEEPGEATRQLIPTLVALHLGTDPKVLEGLAAWRAKAKQASDCWLWHQTLMLDARAGGAEALAVVRDTRRDVFLRAAALRSLAAANHPDALDCLAQAWSRLEGKGLLRTVLPEAAAAGLVDLKPDVREDVVAAAVTKAILLLGEKGLPERTGIVLRRNLAAYLRTDDMGPSPTPWQAALEAARMGAPPAPTRDGGTYARPRFFDLASFGRRIAYVIDGSSSMMTLLDTKELQDLQRPVTPSDGAAPPKRASQPELPWQRIKTRWDAAREMLKLSLRELPPKTAFTIVLFGTDAAPLAATPGFVPSDAAHVEAACRELDTIEGGPPTETNPQGTLLGGTNLHGGLWRAFATGPRGLGDYPAGPDLDALELGCDTIFVLSDGAPNEDDWRGDDSPDPAGDAEGLGPKVASRTRPPPPFPGPFNDPDLLVDDTRRMNLLRHVEIHAVAIGRADRGVLGRLTALGRGRVQTIGAGR